MSKEKILAAIRQNKPGPRPLPELTVFRDETTTSSIERYAANLALSKGEVLIDPDGSQLQELVSKASNVASSVPGIPGTIDLKHIKEPAELAHVDLAIIPSRLGVSENGAVWVSEKDIPHRILPFICQHLIVVLSPDNLVYNMNEAYQRIQIDESGFGVFIAGPSKTADIEQALVVGAQGARSLTVVFQ